MAEAGILISTVIFVLLLIVIWNMYVFRNRKFSIPDENEMPFVSVLVPARNEERSIEACITSLLNQNYPSYEVIVLDDNSTDSTQKILINLSKKFSSLRIINGKELPEGWTGKNYACHQLSQKAKGKYLLFTDADTVHFRDSLRLAVSRAISAGADLYSLFPVMEMKTISEKIMMPVLHFTAFSLLPYYLAENTSSPAFAMANGPYMLFRRDSYIRTGGHEFTKGDIVEDVRLAKRIKEKGMKLVVTAGLDVYSCRLYRNFREIWEGFSKNIFPGTGYSTVLLFTIFTVYLILFFFPFIILLLQLFSIMPYNNAVLANSIVQVSMLILMRTIISARFRLGITGIITHPISIPVISLIAFNSWRWNVLGSGSLWKGRLYPKSKIININNNA